MSAPVAIRMPERQLLQGSEAIAEAMIARRLPVLRRLPDDPVHRGARAHGPQAARPSAASA